MNRTSASSATNADIMPKSRLFATSFKLVQGIALFAGTYWDGVGGAEDRREDVNEDLVRKVYQGGATTHLERPSNTDKIYSGAISDKRKRPPGMCEHGCI